MKVRLNDEAVRYPDGLGIYRKADIPRGLDLTIIATTMHKYNDGSQEPVFLLAIPPDGKIVERACTMFRVVEIDGVRKDEYRNA
jgi:hypothetical protein